MQKLNANAARDHLHREALRRRGWNPVVVWECEVEARRGLERVLRRLQKTLQ